MRAPLSEVWVIFSLACSKIFPVKSTHHKVGVSGR
jgi:hypothetical protein